MVSPFHNRPAVSRSAVRAGLVLSVVCLLFSSTPAFTAEVRGVDSELDPSVEALLDSIDIERELLSASRQAGAPDVRALPGRDHFIGSNLQLRRLMPPAYEDGISQMGVFGRRSPREISNIVVSQSGLIPSGKRASDLVWQWGQFLDHDMDLTEPDEANPEHADIEVPLGDPFFDPLGEGGKVIPFSRSIFDPATGSGLDNPRQQMNTITDFIDASNVYGSDAVRLDALRANDGTGRLKVSAGDLLPFNTFGLPNAGGANRTDLFLAGDIRVNEQMGLAAMHTLWVREHNYWADRIRQRNKHLTGDEVFEAAREMVAFEMQSITFNEFLPLLLGDDALPPYTGHDPNLDPRISSVFSTALYRLGHTMLSPMILRLDGDGNPIPEGHLALRDAFFQPQRLMESGIEPFLKGMASQVMQRIDHMIVDDVRNFLFGPPGAGGLDLASLNIQRGRDHGLPDYNSVRIALGLTPAASFADVSSDPTVQARLAAAYLDVNEIDPWVGALSEDHVPGALVGDLLLTGLLEQFVRLRDGDPNWYQNRLSHSAAKQIEKQTLSEVIKRNTGLKNKHLQRHAFQVPDPHGPPGQQ